MPLRRDDRQRGTDVELTRSTAPLIAFRRGEHANDPDLGDRSTRRPPGSREHGSLPPTAGGLKSCAATVAVAVGVVVDVAGTHVARVPEDVAVAVQLRGVGDRGAGVVAIAHGIEVDVDGLAGRRAAEVRPVRDALVALLSGASRCRCRSRSIVQLASQPSPFTVLPSSHCSNGDTYAVAADALDGTGGAAAITRGQVAVVAGLAGGHDAVAAPVTAQVESQPSPSTCCRRHTLAALAHAVAAGGVDER